MLGIYIPDKFPVTIWSGICLFPVDEDFAECMAYEEMHPSLLSVSFGHGYIRIGFF